MLYIVPICSHFIPLLINAHNSLSGSICSISGSQFFQCVILSNTKHWLIRCVTSVTRCCRYVCDTSHMTCGDQNHTCQNTLSGLTTRLNTRFSNDLQLLSISIVILFDLLFLLPVAGLHYHFIFRSDGQISRNGKYRDVLFSSIILSLRTKAALCIISESQLSRD